MTGDKASIVKFSGKRLHRHLSRIQSMRSKRQGKGGGGRNAGWGGSLRGGRAGLVGEMGGVHVEAEKVLAAQPCLTLCDPLDCVAGQAPLSMGFSRPEYWSGLPCPSPGDLPNPGAEPGSPSLQADPFTV